MERPLEDWLRTMAALGVPPPAKPAPPTAFAPSAPLPPFASAIGALPTNLFAPGLMPPVAEEPAPEVAPAPAPQDFAASGFANAPFQPPKMMGRPRNADVFGQYMETAGMRAPQTAPDSPFPMMPPREQERQLGEPDPNRTPIPALPAQPEAPSDPRVLATQNQRRGMSYRPNPALERRFPGATRMSRLLDRAREQKGWV